MKAKYRYLVKSNHHPNLPDDLRDFQVNSLFDFPTNMFFQVDILAAVLDTDSREHVFAGLPTGYGKSLPMLLIGALSPPGMFSRKKVNLMTAYRFDH